MSLKPIIFNLSSTKKLKTLTFASLLCLGSLMAPDTFAQSANNPLLDRLNPAQTSGGTSRTGPGVTMQGDSALPQDNGSARGQAPSLNNRVDPLISAEEKIRMIEDEEARKASRTKEIREKAFDAAITGLLPLEPDEIIEVIKRYDRTRKVIETPYYERPTPTVSVLPVSLDPGVEPPVLNLATGHVTTISVLDATGEPWPIEDLSWAGDFQFAETESGGHIFRITPLAEFAHGNLSMRLVGLKTPITITMNTQREVVQYRVDIRMPGDGPNAQVPLIQTGPGLQAGDGLLTAILDGSPPPDIEKLDVSGVDGRTTAFRANGLVYLRTPLTLLSPGWISSARSGDGTSVFVMNDTPIVLLSDQGKVQRAQLKEDTDEELL